VQKYAQDQVLVYGATTFRAFREFVVEYDEPYYESLNAVVARAERAGVEEVVLFDHAIDRWDGSPGRAQIASAWPIKRRPVPSVVR
jgi:hypothetical protein